MSGSLGNSDNDPAGDDGDVDYFNDPEAFIFHSTSFATKLPALKYCHTHINARPNRVLSKILNILFST